ncbi:MAG: molybdopterin-synthase adenylyltransferase MoeB [Chloroflexi bacterium]|nr:molybdopterin-synthase adenylyltransferase MoeB [Chloroflexota bacterium]
MVKVYIPTVLRKITNGQTRVEAEAADIRSLLDRLEARFPGLKGQLVDSQGNLFRFVNVYVNNREVDELQGLGTPLREEDEVALIPAMAGGAVGGAFSLEQGLRYARHIILPEIGGQGQRKLLRSKVLLIGAGGLGSPAALYLGAAGVGTMGIVDFDTVDLTNLHRQILHGHKNIGRLKVDSARETVNDINPDVQVVPHREALTSANALEIIGQYDLVVNGCDNFATRYLANDACYFLKKPLVDGSIFRFEGQATVFMPGKGCYRCLFPAPPPPGAVPSCAEAGVLGVLPGIIGVIQAIETIKLILGLGEPLVNRLLLFDSLAMEFREVKIRRAPDCPLCGDNPTVTELIDYEAFCGGPMATTGG